MKLHPIGEKTVLTSFALNQARGASGKLFQFTNPTDATTLHNRSRLQPLAQF